MLVRPEDEPLMVKFHAARLSQRVAHDRFVRICFLDYDREIALLVDRPVPESGEHEILAIGRMSKLHGANAAEVAILVRDQYQRRGLGLELLRRLIQVARDERLDSVHAYMLQENVEMRAPIEKLGFRILATADPGIPLQSSISDTDSLIPSLGR
jgi:acetyltransferase